MFKLTGQVVKGLGEGRRLGYPTANLALPDSAIRPPAGVYACWVDYVGGSHQPGLLVSGVYLETNQQPRCEVYLLDWQGDLYGQVLRVEVVTKLREVVKTTNPAQLIDLIKQDIVQGRLVLGLN